MSTTTSCTSTSSAPAPWRALFSTHLTQTPNREFALSTAALSPSNQPLPHVRTCGFRGFFPSPNLSPPAVEALQQSGVGLNPDVFESDMLSFTTDARMEKVRDLDAADGEVEGVFWVKEVMSQWRVRGRGVVIGGEEEERARGEVWGWLREKGQNQDGDGEWNWDRMVTTYFANHTPVMRGLFTLSYPILCAGKRLTIPGSFKAPPPGQPKTELPADSPLKPGQKVHDLHDSVARRHFRVVVIKPEVVERLDLSDYENPRRWRWALEGGRWVEVELWP
jgi:pyridoxamine 5'-phosphate oxidase